jgi:hypothetical protein
MKHLMRVAAVGALLVAAQATNAQDKGLTVDGNGNVEISGNLKVSGSITVTGGLSATGDIATSSSVYTDDYFYKWFGSEKWRLDYGPVHRYAAYWYYGAPAAVSATSEHKPVAKALEFVQGIKGVSYPLQEPNKIGETRGYGLVADGIEKSLPMIVLKDQAGHAMVDDRHAVVFLVEAVKEQQKLIETLQNELRSLTARLNAAASTPR